MVATPFYTHTDRTKGLYFLHTFTSKLYASLIMTKLIGWNNTYCGFDLRFPDEWWYLAYFHVPVGHLCVFFGGKIPSQSFCPSLKWIIYLGFSLLRYLSFLYILYIKPVLENIFSSSINHIFILLIILIWFFFTLLWPCFFIISSFACVLGVIFKKSSPRLMLRIIFLIFSSRSFMISSLIFKS